MFLATATIPLPAVTLSTKILAAVPALALVGGYLLARESRGKFILEIIAIFALEVAIIIPATIDAGFAQTMVTNLLSRYPIMAFVLGAALIRDGGWKIIPGIGLMAASGALQFTPGIP